MLVTNLTILVLAGFVGFAVISKVPNTLHTPLMSGTNAIHGIVLLGGLIVLGTVDGLGTLDKLLLVIAIAFGTINIVGGFLVTDRMLEMFKGSKAERGRGGRRGGRREVTALATSFIHDANFIDVLYIVAFAPVHLRADGPHRTAHGGARQPHRRGRHGGRDRRDAAPAQGSATGAWSSSASPSARRSAIPAARQVKMTAMPQMVALFNGVGGGAVALIAWVEFRSTGGFADEALYVAVVLAVRRDRRLDLVLGLEHRVRQAAGTAPGAADPASRPAVHQRRAARSSAWPAR